VSYDESKGNPVFTITSSLALSNVSMASKAQGKVSTKEKSRKKPRQRILRRKNAKFSLSSSECGSAFGSWGDFGEGISKRV
jgi:hypothetical protein